MLQFARPWLSRAIGLAALLALAGCARLGPPSFARDRFDYNTAIAASWKEQTLLNIVKLRYADMPLFVEVASVVSGYTLEGSVDIGGTVFSDVGDQGNLLTLGTAGTYTDRPTITYAPITGAKFNRSFMTPIPPRAIFFLLQSGWPVDLILPIAVDSINGLRRGTDSISSDATPESDFDRLVRLLRTIQQSGAMGMRIIQDERDNATTFLFFDRQNLTESTMTAINEVDRLLGLDPARQETTVTYGLVPRTDREIAMLTRSTLQIMIELARQIDVPAEHVQDGRTIPGLPSMADTNKRSQVECIRVHASQQKPENPFVAIRYEEHWFWIDKRDFESKRTFVFLMIIFSLTETGGNEALPLVTIPAG